MSNPAILEPLVQKLAYRAKLDADDRAAILGLRCTVKTMERHETFVTEGQWTTHSCVLLSGYAIRVKMVASGQRQIVAIHMKGEMVDLQNSLLVTADHSVQMLTPGDVAMIPREEILRLSTERPLVGRAMWIETLVDGSIFREWIANIGARDARARVAHLFCEFALRLEAAGLAHDKRFELPMSQEQIGEATGLTSVHVNRSIRALEADGLIDRSSPRSVYIGDWRKLADAADFDSNYLHLPRNEPGLSQSG